MIWCIYQKHRLVNRNVIPMGIPWETSHGMGCDSTHLYFPWDSSHVIATSEIKWERQNDTKLSYLAEMNGLLYFAIQIQSWFVKSQSKSNHSPIIFSNIKTKSKLSPKIRRNPGYSQQKRSICFQSTQSKSGPDSKFWSGSQPGSNPNSTKFTIVRVQSNPSPVQCSYLILRLYFWILKSINFVVLHVSLYM